MSSTIATSSLKLPAAREPQKLRTDSLILSGVFLLLFFGPLAFGAVEPWAIFVLEASSALLFTLWVWRQSTTDAWTLRDNPLFRPMLAFAVIVALQLIFGWTAYRHETFSQALLYVAYGMLAFLVTQSLRRSSQAKALAIIVSVYGIAFAGLALLQGLQPNGKLFWLRTPQLGGWIYGPYVNHNHYAGLMEMLTPVPLVFCLTRYARGHLRTAAAAGAALMAGTIFFSGSRGGMIAFLAELILLGALLLKLQRGPKLAAGFGLFAAVMLALLAWIGGAELTKRVTSIGSETRQELSGGLRSTINKDGIKMFAHKPIFGWGLRVFPVAYPQFRSFFTDKIVNEAHNDYLQMLVEMGSLGFLTTVWFLAVVYRRGTRKLTVWAWDLNGAVGMATLLGISGILVHSFVDFNLQIPANAALFYVLCATAAADTRFGANRRMRRKRTPGPDLELSSVPTHLPA